MSQISFADAEYAGKKEPRCEVFLDEMDQVVPLVGPGQAARAFELFRPSLASTKDGRQGSTGWVQGGNRLFKAVGEEETESILLAYQANRVETWVVTTRGDGATEVLLLDAAGKPKNTRASLLLPKRANLSGARQ